MSSERGTHTQIIYYVNAMAYYAKCPISNSNMKKYENMTCGLIGKYDPYTSKRQPKKISWQCDQM